MEANTVTELLIRMVAEASGIPEADISEDSTWEELGMDSLEFMELMADVSMHVKNIPKSRFFAIDTVGDLIKEAS
jgi:acyl carrier protein